MNVNFYYVTMEKGALLVHGLSVSSIIKRVSETSTGVHELSDEMINCNLFETPERATKSQAEEPVIRKF